MRILLLIILLTTTIVHNSLGQVEYSYSDDLCEEESRITERLYTIDPKEKELWVNTLTEAEKAVAKETDLAKVTGSLARLYQMYDVVSFTSGKNRCLQKMMHLAETSGDNEIYVRAKILQAHSLIRERHFDSTINCYQEALKYLTPKKAYRQIAKLHCFLAYAYDEIHNEVLCIRNILEAVTIVENEFPDDQLLTGEVYLHTAIIYQNQGDYKKASGYIEGALIIFRHNKNSEIKMFRNLLNTATIVSADIELATKNTDRAIELYKEGIQGFIEMGFDNSARNTLKFLSDGHNGLGIAYLRKGDDKAALQNMFTALQIRNNLANQDKIADSYITIGEYYNTKNMPDSLKYYMETGFNIARKYHNYRLMTHSAHTLSKFYDHRKEYKKALDYLQIAESSFFAVSDLEKTKNAAREEMDYMFDQERALAERVKVQELEKEEKKIMWATAFCAMSAVLLTVIFILFHKKKKKNQLLREQRDALEERSQELLVQQEEISQKNQELRATTEMLEESNKELRATTRKLEASNRELKMLSAVASMTSNSIFITNYEGDIIWLNDAFTKETGITLDEIGDNPILENKAMPADTKRIYEKVIRTKQPQEYTTQITHVKGVSMWVQVAVTPVLDEDDDISMIVWVNTNITELRDATIKLEQRNRELQMLSAVAANTSNSIFMTDKDGEFMWMNDAFSRETNIPLSEMHTHPALKAAAMTPETRAAYEIVVATRKTYSYTAEMKHLHRPSFWVKSSVTPVMDDKGEIMMIVWVSTDITELHNAYEKIDSQNKEINESITYARRIQDAIQPMKIFSDEILGEHFVINMPRNIVSGDFHWVGYKNGLSVFTVADCTGHGVPGAFISMLGQMMLTQTLDRLADITAANILNMVRKGIIHQLHQRDKFGVSSDSIDASMFVYDRENCVIDYAGAFSHAYILRFGTPDAETEAICEESGSKIVVNDEGDAYLIRLKPNRMTLGIDRRDAIPFVGTKFKVRHGDIAYATTDGYPDQFGGDKQKRFYVVTFEKMLLKYCHLPMDEQRKQLEKTYLDWKGDYEQTDDVHVLGIVL